jgi:hypothetical protein
LPSINIQLKGFQVYGLFFITIAGLAFVSLHQHTLHATVFGASLAHGQPGLNASLAESVAATRLVRIPGRKLTYGTFQQTTSTFQRIHILKINHMNYIKKVLNKIISYNKYYQNDFLTFSSGTKINHIYCTMYIKRFSTKY